MTNKQINKAIAMLRGWRFVEDDPDYEPYWEDPNGTKIAVNFIDYRVPNCTGCLNAMHEAEEWLMHEDLYAYGCYDSNLYYGHRNCIHATARQRAEAFLKTLGKWEEEA
jgi:hypothetical protein